MNRYKVTKTLGDGTYGSVLKGQNKQSGEIVAKMTENEQQRCLYVHTDRKISSSPHIMLLTTAQAATPSTGRSQVDEQVSSEAGCCFAAAAVSVVALSISLPPAAARLRIFVSSHPPPACFSDSAAFAADVDGVNTGLPAARTGVAGACRSSWTVSIATFRSSSACEQIAVALLETASSTPGIGLTVPFFVRSGQRAAVLQRELRARRRVDRGRVAPALVHQQRPHLRGVAVQAQVVADHLRRIGDAAGVAALDLARRIPGHELRHALVAEARHRQLGEGVAELQLHLLEGGVDLRRGHAR